MYKQCREENTIKKYQQYFKTCKEWATSHQHLRQDFQRQKLIGIYREGMWVYISLSSKICPLKQIKFYLALSKTSENSEEFISRSLSRGK